MRSLLKNAKLSPRKMRLAANLVRGKYAVHARILLKLNIKKSCQILLKVLNSAVANAVQKDMTINNLIIQEVNVGDAMRMKRFMASGKGKSSPIIRRYCNVRIILQEKQSNQKSELDHGDFAGEKIEDIQNNNKHDQQKLKVQSDIYDSDGKKVKDEDVDFLETMGEDVQFVNTPNQKTIDRLHTEDQNFDTKNKKIFINNQVSDSMKSNKQKLKARSDICDSDDNKDEDVDCLKIIDKNVQFKNTSKQKTIKKAHTDNQISDDMKNNKHKTTNNTQQMSLGDDE